MKCVYLRCYFTKSSTATFGLKDNMFPANSLLFLQGMYARMLPKGKQEELLEKSKYK